MVCSTITTNITLTSRPQTQLCLSDFHFLLFETVTMWQPWHCSTWHCSTFLQHGNHKMLSHCLLLCHILYVGILRQVFCNVKKHLWCLCATFDVSLFCILKVYHFDVPLCQNRVISCHDDLLWYFIKVTYTFSWPAAMCAQYLELYSYWNRGQLYKPQQFFDFTWNQRPVWTETCSFTGGHPERYLQSSALGRTSLMTPRRRSILLWTASVEAGGLMKPTEPLYLRVNQETTKAVSRKALTTPRNSVHKGYERNLTKGNAHCKRIWFTVVTQRPDRVTNPV